MTCNRTLSAWSRANAAEANGPSGLAGLCSTDAAAKTRAVRYCCSSSNRAAFSLNPWAIW